MSHKDAWCNTAILKSSVATEADQATMCAHNLHQQLKTKLQNRWCHHVGPWLLNEVNWQALLWRRGNNMERRAKIGEEALGGWAAASQANSYCAQKQKEFDIWPLLGEKPKQHLQSRQWSMEAHCPHNKEQINHGTLDKQINRGFLGVSGKPLKIHALRNRAQIPCEKFWNITDCSKTLQILFRVLWLTSQ